MLQALGLVAQEAGDDVEGHLGGPVHSLELLHLGFVVRAGRHELGQVLFSLSAMRRHIRAGHLRYFLIFSLIKNDFLHFLLS